MPDTINGLPLHVLLLHVVVVLLPLTAVMLVAGAVWPAARERLGIATPALALVVLGAVPVTTHAGSWLRSRIDPNGQNPAITRHAALGRGLLVWAAGMFVVALAIWLLDRRARTAAPAPTPVSGRIEPWAGGTATMTRPERAARPTRAAWLPWQRIAAVVLALVVSVGGVVQLYRIGDSGAHAAWDYVGKLPPR